MIIPDSSGMAGRVDELSRRICHTVTVQLDHYQARLSLCKQQLTGATRPIDSLMLRLDHLSGNLEHAIQTILYSAQSYLHEQSIRLQHKNPTQSLHLFQQELKGLQQRIHHAANKILFEKEQNFKRSSGLLDAVSPLATLARGYAIARKTGGGKTVITESDQVQQGEGIEVVLSKGRLSCSVLTAHGKKTQRIN
jgi:exodeoxyribonuclease VII large subunit